MPSVGSSHSIEDRLAELVFSCSFPIHLPAGITPMLISPLKMVSPPSQEKDEELGQVAAVGLMVESIRESFAEDRRGICKFRSLIGS